MIENPHINPDWWVDPPDDPPDYRGCPHDEDIREDNEYGGLFYCDECFNALYQQLEENYRHSNSYGIYI